MKKLWLLAFLLVLSSQSYCDGDIQEKCVDQVALTMQELVKINHDTAQLANRINKVKKDTNSVNKRINALLNICIAISYFIF